MYGSPRIKIASTLVALHSDIGVTSALVIQGGQDHE
jgi:hypothetical protein